MLLASSCLTLPFLTEQSQMNVFARVVAIMIFYFLVMLYCWVKNNNIFINSLINMFNIISKLHPLWANQLGGHSWDFLQFILGTF